MNINSKADLDAAILELEKRKIIQEADLAAHFKTTRENLSPLNLIKNGVTKLTEMPDFAGGLLKTVAGLGVGILSKKLFIGKSSSLIKRIIGPIFEFVIAKTAINNVDKVKAYGTSLYNNFLKKNDNHNHTN